jgi:hypothetical protein
MNAEIHHVNVTVPKSLEEAAKHFRSADWKSLSIPRNRSAEFNAYLADRPGVADKEKQLDAVVDFANKADSNKK